MCRRYKEAPALREAAVCASGEECGEGIVAVWTEHSRSALDKGGESGASAKVQASRVLQVRGQLRMCVRFTRMRRTKADTPDRGCARCSSALRASLFQ